MKIILSCLLAAWCSMATAHTAMLSVTGKAIDTGSAIAYFTGMIKKDRVILNWAIDNNLETDRFEVQRSKDGKNFETVALVFGTEQPGTAEYQFFEKVKKIKPFYRLKVIHKNNTVNYSEVVVPAG